MRGLSDERNQRGFSVFFIYFRRQRFADHSNATQKRPFKNFDRTFLNGTVNKIVGRTDRESLILDLFRGIWSEVLQFCTESNLAILIFDWLDLTTNQIPGKC